MNNTSRLIATAACLAVCTAAQAAPRAPQPAKAKSRTPAPAVEQLPTAKVVNYGPRDIVPLNTQLRYTTLIILPRDEVILDYVCGDKDLWNIQGDQNFVYVKPSMEGAKTNLSLVTESGQVFSFLLREISTARSTTAGSPAPDLTVFVEMSPTGTSTPAPLQPARRLVSAKELEAVQGELEDARAENARIRQNTRDAIDAGVAARVTNVRFAYRFEAGKAPFYVRAMYHDERFTYIQARPEETPTVMEELDGKPSLLNFEYRDGLYVIPKIVDRGYLVIGRKRLGFKRDE